LNNVVDDGVDELPLHSMANPKFGDGLSRPESSTIESRD